MPPFVPRKRHRSPTPSTSIPKTRSHAPPSSKPTRPTIFDTLDDEPKPTRTPDENKALLDSLDGEEEDSSLSGVSSEVEFEDALSAPPAKKTKQNSVEEEDESDEEMEWEDAVPSALVHDEV